MRVATIGELVEPIGRWQASSEDAIEYLDIESIDREEKAVRGFKHTPVAEAPSRARQAILPGDIVLSNVRPNLNAVAQVPEHAGVLVASTGFTVLRPRTAMVSDRYLFHFLRTPAFVGAMTRRATGASYPAISPKDVLATPLPLPDFSEQRRIAAILDKADEVRRKRAQASATVEGLLRSVFLEMFGDPLTGPKNCERRELASVATVDRGKFTPRPRNDPAYYGGPWPFIQTGDVARSRGYVRTWTQTLNDKGTTVSKFFPKGTIAMSIAANIGDTAILGFDSYFPDSVVGISVTPGVVEPEYLECCLRFFKRALMDAAPETAQKNINLKVLRPLAIPVPPLVLQQRFAKFYRGTAEYSLKLTADGPVEQLSAALSSEFFSAGAV